MEINILVVCGSPVKKGNQEAYTREVLKEIETFPDVRVEVILLAPWYKTFRGCNHCNYCATKQKPDRFCSIDDQMTEVYPKLLAADAIILSSPAYATRITGLMANFMDRMRALYHGKLYLGSLHNKVGGALCVAFGRHSGVETTLLSIVQAYMLWGMIPANCGLVSPYGAGGLSSYGGTGKVDEDKLIVLKDSFGIKTGRMLCRDVVEKARIVKAGKQALNLSKLRRNPEAEKE
jgi:multimeric flavodoxin WrbA